LGFPFLFPLSFFLAFCTEKISMIQSTKFTTPTTPNAAFWNGFLTVLPLTIGVIPFGLVTGIAGIKAGMNVFEVTMMSALVFAGASQLVALQLMQSGAAIPFVLLAGLVVNLRYVMYSSAIAKHLEPFRGWLKTLAAFLLVDQNFALTLERYQQLGPKLTPWYFLGGGAPLWINWVICTFIGALLGARVPSEWGLEFAIPLGFMVLLIPALRDRPSLAAALVGGLVATALVALPYRSGLFVGAIAGIAAGVWLENRKRGRAAE
jgi:4-azaleucine resistance transporter AzlC